MPSLSVSIRLYTNVLEDERVTSEYEVVELHG